METKESPFIFEEWKTISELSVPKIVPNKYLISNFGRVYNKERNIYQAIVPTDYNLPNPYYRVSLQTTDGKSLYYLIHRIVMIEFNFIPDYKEKQVNHIYGGILPNLPKGKSINTVWNLEWCTPSENIQHAFDTGIKTQYHGEDCSWATISNEQAEQIAQLICEQKYSHKEIADIVGCKLNIVRSISDGSNWKDVYNKYNLEKYKKKVNKFSDAQLEQLCEYFQNNKNKYVIKTDLYRNALKDLFNIEYTDSMSATMCRFFNRQVRRDISDKYDF